MPDEATESTEAVQASSVSYSRAAVVQIFLDSNGDLDVDDKSARVQAGGGLTFKIKASTPSGQHSTLISFVVLMKKETPFVNNKAWAGGTATDDAKVNIASNANDPHGNNSNNEYTYPYSVMASDGTDTYHLDPDVIVGPQS